MEQDSTISKLSLLQESIALHPSQRLNIYMTVEIIPRYHPYVDLMCPWHVQDNCGPSEAKQKDMLRAKGK